MNYLFSARHFSRQDLSYRKRFSECAQLVFHEVEDLLPTLASDYFKEKEKANYAYLELSDKPPSFSK